MMAFRATDISMFPKPPVTGGGGHVASARPRRVLPHIPPPNDGASAPSGPDAPSVFSLHPQGRAPVTTEPETKRQE